MILATNNKNKIREIKQILSNSDIKSLAEVDINIEVEEDQNTFFGNALKKSKEIYMVTKEPVIADDSGICIDEFDGWPGVMTHRFLGEEATDRDRNLAIIDKMKNLERDSRKASVVCSLVYYDGTNYIEGKGVLKGYIVVEPRGENGFGFDEIFEISNVEFGPNCNLKQDQIIMLKQLISRLKGKTLAELNSEEKNQISARYLATVDLKNKLEKQTK